jgi:lysophospholipase
MNWDRDRLLMDLTKFSFRSKPEVKGEIVKYYDFYGLNFYREFEGLEQRVGWLDASDFRIVMQSFKPVDATATVYVFHGYFDHAGIYQHLIRFLLKSGFAVVVYDMPGHGLSSGRPTSIQSFQQYQDAMNVCLAVCKGNMPGPFHCVGQSTGGAVLIDRLMNSETHGEIFDKVVLLSPLVRPKGWESITRLHSIIKPFVKVWYRSFSQNSADVKFLQFLKEHDPLQSKWMAVDWISALKDWVPRIESGKRLKRKVLIIQGTGDKTVDWSHNIDVLKRLFSEVKITYIEKAEHHLVNESVIKRQAVFKAMLTELDDSVPVAKTTLNAKVKVTPRAKVSKKKVKKEIKA